MLNIKKINLWLWEPRMWLVARRYSTKAFFIIVWELRGRRTLCRWRVIREMQSLQHIRFAWKFSLKVASSVSGFYYDFRILRKTSWKEFFIA